MDINLNLTEVILAVVTLIGTYFAGRHRGGRSARGKLKVSDPKGADN